MTTEGLFNQLRIAYDDNDAEERASQRLGSMKQGTKKFSTFIADFDRTLLDAGGVGWDDKAKKSFLMNSIALDLRTTIAAMPIPTTYRRYCDLLHTASANLESIQRIKNRGGRQHSTTTSEAEVVPATDAMDWEPATVTAAAACTQRAQWVSKEVLEKRKELGRCLRCGKDGHFLRQCTLLPAVRPKREKATTMAAVAETEDEEEEELKE